MHRVDWQENLWGLCWGRIWQQTMAFYRFYLDDYLLVGVHDSLHKFIKDFDSKHRWGNCLRRDIRDPASLALKQRNKSACVGHYFLIWRFVASGLFPQAINAPLYIFLRSGLQRDSHVRVGVRAILGCLGCAPTTVCSVCKSWLFQPQCERNRWNISFHHFPLSLPAQYPTDLLRAKRANTSYNE